MDWVTFDRKVDRDEIARVILLDWWYCDCDGYCSFCGADTIICFECELNDPKVYTDSVRVCVCVCIDKREGETGPLGSKCLLEKLKHASQRNAIKRWMDRQYPFQ